MTVPPQGWLGLIPNSALRDTALKNWEPSGMFSQTGEEGALEPKCS